MNGLPLTSLAHTCQAILSRSIVVIGLDDAREDWNLHGWSPEWLIASLVCTLRSQVKITCHLFSGLSPQFPQEFHMLSFREVAVCVCNCTCMCTGMWRVSASGDPCIALSMRWRRGFVLGPFPEGSIMLCCVSDGNQKLLRRKPKDILYCFKRKVITRHCQNSPTVLLRLQIPVCSFPKQHINSSLLHVRRKSEATVEEAKSHILLF